MKNAINIIRALIFFPISGLIFVLINYLFIKILVIPLHYWIAHLFGLNGFWFIVGVFFSLAFGAGLFEILSSIFQLIMSLIQAIASYISPYPKYTLFLIIINAIWNGVYFIRSYWIDNTFNSGGEKFEAFIIISLIVGFSFDIIRLSLKLYILQQEKRELEMSTNKRTYYDATVIDDI